MQPLAKHLQIGLSSSLVRVWRSAVPQDHVSSACVLISQGWSCFKSKTPTLGNPSGKAELAIPP